MNNLAYKNDIPLSQSPQYTYTDNERLGKDAAGMNKNEQKEIGNGKIKVINTVPKMTDLEREKSKKIIGNDLYEIFTRIQSQLKSS